MIWCLVFLYKICHYGPCVRTCRPLLILQTHVATIFCSPSHMVGNLFTALAHKENGNTVKTKAQGHPSPTVQSCCSFFFCCLLKKAPPCIFLVVFLSRFKTTQITNWSAEEDILHLLDSRKQSSVRLIATCVQIICGSDCSVSGINLHGQMYLVVKMFAQLIGGAVIKITLAAGVCLINIIRT
jgi:hypothetical protein